MVYYDSPKRFRRPKEANDMTSVLDIPDEIWISILESIDTPDILKVRLACSDVVPACNSVLQERLTTLYIHPSPLCLRTALDICAHPFLSQGIEKVVLLGKPMWAEIRKVDPDYIPPMYSGEQRSMAFEHHQSGSALLECKVRFRSWPEELPRGKGLARFGTLDSAEQPMGSALPASYAPLVGALANLPKLHALGFAEGVFRRGFNQVSDMTMSAHANKMVQPHSCNGKSCCVDGDDHRLADAEVLYGLLFHPGLRFVALHLAAELPFIEQAIRRVGSGSAAAAAFEPDSAPRNALAAMSSVDLSVLCRSPGMTLILYHQLLQHASGSLESLRIAIVPTTPVKGRLRELILEELLTDLHFPQLKTFEIDYVDSTTPKAVCKSIPHPGRLVRPLCQSFNLSTFLDEHKPTLRQVSIRNIISSSAEHTCAVTNLRRALRTLHQTDDHPGVRVEWLINWYNHDPFCKKTDHHPTMDCKYQCGKYSLFNWPVGLEDMRALASPGDLDVRLEPGRKVWDFGKVVGRSGLLVN